MLFPTTDFASFFCLVFLGHWLLNHEARWWKPFMLIASYVFYGWWSPRYVLLLVGVSAIAQVGAIAVARQTEERRRMRVLGLAVAATIAPLLSYMSYGFYAVNRANAASALGVGWTPPLIEVVLPVGVSFYTFMAISYVVDVHRREIAVASWTDVFLYLAFFPHLVAGPIVRPAELIPQLDERRDQRHLDFANAAWLILGGLFKKVVISSYLSTAIVEPVFGDPSRHSALEVLVGVWGFAVVIYAVFSGYTVFAIGVAQLLGFSFPQYFYRPYTAVSIQDFWRRWHMTLSRWLRDYLYIPLGGNRRGARRTYVNLLITMTLGGLWHGAAWTFVVWGLLHGGFLAVGHWKRGKREAGMLADPPDTATTVWLQRLAAFHLVCLGWVFFRADSIGTAFALLGRLVTGWDTPTELVTPLVLTAIAAGIGAQYLPSAPAEVVKDLAARARPIPLGIGVAFVLFVITTLGPQGVAPFIYFQF